MKKLILILAVIITACNPPADKETIKEQEGAGFFLPIEGEKFVVGTDTVTKIWMNYIKAHNDHDLETIMSMVSDSIKFEKETGRVISGKEMYRESLEGWFAAAKPTVKVHWAMPYKAVNSGEEWIIAGHEVTSTVDGKKTVGLNMIDGQIVDGKIKQFYIYNKKIPEPAKSDSKQNEEDLE